jgi:hypothetical protein
MPAILICVGAAKAGTSWLYRHLLRHPDCHLRSIKELHFFDMLEAGTQARVAQRLDRRIARLEGSAIPDRRPDQRRAERALRDAWAWREVLAEAEGPAGLEAYRRYLMGGLTGGRRLVADITPAYALLPVERMEQMARVAPDVRVVYLLRDPVGRLWSQARMAARRITGAASAVATASAEMGRMIDEIAAGRLGRADYAGTIGRLRAAVAAPRLLVLLMDEMLSAPGLARLQSCLGIGPAAGDFTHPVHAGMEIPLAEDLRRRAMAVLRPQYDFVARLVPELPAAWRRNMNEGLA